MFINDATKEIMLKERVHRTRSTVLQSSGKVGVALLAHSQICSCSVDVYKLCVGVCVL